MLWDSNDTVFQLSRGLLSANCVISDFAALHDIYIGCFRAFGNQKDISSAFSLQVPLSYNEITVENCIDACIMRNYTYAGVQVGLHVKYYTDASYQLLHVKVN